MSVDLPVELSIEGSILHERATTLGGGGMFLSVTRPLLTGTEIALRSRPAKYLPAIRARARVLYQIPEKGTGVQFTEISTEDRQTILRLILRRLADRRQHPRAPLVTQVVCDASMSLAYARDVSQGGMFVEAQEPASVGSKVSLRFHLDDGGPVIIAEGEVTYRVEKLGVGVQFSKLSPADRTRVEAYAAKSAAATGATDTGLVV